jgi:hypothetical protein
MPGTNRMGEVRNPKEFYMLRLDTRYYDDV